MKIVKKNIVYLLVFVIITVIFAVFNQYLNEILIYLSPKNEVKLHFINKVRHEFYALYFISVLILLIFWIALPFIKKYLFRNPEFYKKFYFNTGILKYLLVIFVAIYILIAPIIILYSLDISTDESTYAYTGYHYYHFDKFMIKLDNGKFVIPKDMVLQNLPLIFLKPMVPFSIHLMRYITYFYSILLVIILFYYFRKNYGTINSKVFLILLASYPGFIFLSGTSFGENSALLFALISIYLFNRYYKSNKLIGLHLSSLLLSFSVLTKIQLGIFLIPALIIFSLYYYLKGKDYKHILIFLSEVFVLSVLIVAAFWLTNYNISEIKGLVALYYSISINSVTYAEKWASILINFERFFNYHMLLFVPLLFYYYFDRKHEKSFEEKYLFIIIILNALWFITMKGYNYRFMYYSQIGIILLSIKPISIYYSQSITRIKLSIKLLLSVLLIIGLIQNIKMTVNGVCNDYLFFLNGNNPLKTFFNFRHNDDQNVFYSKVRSIINSNEPIYYIGAESEVMAFIPNVFYTFDVTTYNPNLNISYIIRTSINDQLGIHKNDDDFLNTKCEKVFEQGLYSLYKIKELK